MRNGSMPQKFKIPITATRHDPVQMIKICFSVITKRQLIKKQERHIEMMVMRPNILPELP
ncbi:hypothetical protein NQ527_03550 [Eshraghiella crossota]|uniref:Uncharacterized protein n=1 Tax=Eshraghiella crossota DSM 2876 TaxID=511680 RepID=D4S1Z6_9FIRM|nr:hypothetical protein [Butyrivibrio crossotus]EFF67698.1 hypothetical protein BUTYVIB_02118 [Butyrivibrio crossotus DSM 2876]UWO51369.1 hypothetical protein NQ527_03550 [Butyrivibrio crossotus]